MKNQPITPIIPDEVKRLPPRTYMLFISKIIGPRIEHVGQALVAEAQVQHPLTVLDALTNWLEKNASYTSIIGKIDRDSAGNTIYTASCIGGYDQPPEYYVAIVASATVS